MSGVRVNMRSVVAAQARNEGDFSFLFVPDGGSVEGSGLIGDVLEAMDETWDLLGDDPDWMGPAVSAFGPAFSPLGEIIEVDYVSGPPGSFEGWLEDFAERLRTAGLSGKVTTMPNAWSVIPGWYEEIPGGHLGAYAAYNLVDPGQCTEVKRYWNVNDQVTGRITELAESWSWSDAVTIVGAGRATAVGPRHADVFARAVHAGGGMARLSHFDLKVITAHQVQTYPQGLVTWGIWEPGRPSASIARELVRVLSVLAADTRLGFIQHSNALAEHWRDAQTRLRHLPPELVPVRYHLNDATALWGEWVPDARGLMVLSEAHLAKARDLSAWQVTELVPGKYLVRDRDLKAWYLPTDGPEPWVLERARSEFGELIVSPDLVEAEGEKAREANAAQYR